MVLIIAKASLVNILSPEVILQDSIAEYVAAALCAQLCLRQYGLALGTHSCLWP